MFKRFVDEKGFTIMELLIAVGIVVSRWTDLIQ